MYKICHSIKKALAVCWIESDKLLIYKNGWFLLNDISEHSYIRIAHLKLKIFKRILSCFSICRRFLRLYPFSPSFDKKTNLLFFSFDHSVYSLDLDKKIISKEICLRHNAKRCLSICLDTKGHVYFGEYPTKYDGLPVCIYKRNLNKKWEVVYQFEPNKIRHIHLLKIYKNDLFCFTGDENDQVFIYRFNNCDFLKQPFILASGSQMYRSCVASFKENFIYYLTDNPYFQNKLCCLDLNAKNHNELFDVDNSVIYGLDCQNSSCLYFSTAVEKNLKKDEHGNNVSIPIDGAHGGIRSKNASVYCFNYDIGKLDLIFSLKKDFLSIKLFGLGSFLFTCNYSPKYLAVTSLSLGKGEKTLVFDLKEEGK